MEKYRYLEHTADTKFQAFGETLEEAFINSALATTDVVIEVADVNLVTEKKLHIESESKQSLLYDFLEKVLLLMDTDHFAIAEFSSLKITKSSKYVLDAVVKGDFGIEKYDYKRQIKAITYNDMLIEEKPSNVMIQVVLDL